MVSARQPNRPHFLQVAGRGCEVLFYSTFHGARLIARALRPGALRRESHQELLGRFLAELFESLGAAFIKIGQILSSRPDLLPASIITHLRRLQDEVAPFDVRRIPRLIEEALGRPMEEVFESFDLEPVSSASIAHVHRARLADGRHVAVKIRRPAAVRQVSTDLRWFSWMARLLDQLPPLRILPLSEAVGEVGEAVAQQLDFRLEAENNRRFREHFRGHRNVAIPELVEELCSDSVLTMEFMDRLEKVGITDLPRESRETSTLVGLKALFKMIFIDGFIHADLHPGNFFLRPEGEVVLLDMGLVARLVGDNLQHFKDFFFGLVANDGRKCARVVDETATYRAPEFDRRRFEESMVRLIAHHSRLNAEEFEVTAFVYQLFDIQRRHRLRGSTHFTMTILSLAVYEGIVKQLYPQLDFQRQALAFLVKHRLNTQG